jgi:hypothetical protein
MKVENNSFKKISIPFFLRKDNLLKQDNLFIKQKDVHLLKILYQKGLKDNIQVETPDLATKINFPKLIKQFHPLSGKSRKINLKFNNIMDKSKTLTTDNQSEAMHKTNSFSKINIKNRNTQNENKSIANFCLTPVHLKYHTPLKNQRKLSYLNTKFKPSFCLLKRINYLSHSRSTKIIQRKQTCEQECQTLLSSLSRIFACK